MEPVAPEASVSPSLPGALANVQADVVVSLGASIGACRYPVDFLLELWNATGDGGMLVMELADSIGTRRSALDRLRDARATVPEKVAAMLTRHRDWCTGHALHAVGGAGLLNPLGPGEAAEVLNGAGASHVEAHGARPDTVLIVAYRA
jgi:hypothetical protein